MAAQQARTNGREDADADADVSATDGWRARVVSRSLRRATEKSLSRGEAFIKAAQALLYERGLDGFTVQQVADAAGQSLRTFYQHFSGKDDLLLALLEEELIVHAAYIRKHVSRSADPIERLRTFVTAGVGHARLDAHTTAMARYSLNLSASHPAELSSVQRPVVELARELVREAVEAGAIPACDPDVAAYFLMSMKVAYGRSRVFGNDLGTAMPSPDELATMCVRGLGGAVPPPR